MRRIALAAAATALALAPEAGAAGSVSFRAALTPRSHLFGEPVTAAVEVVVDRADAGSVQVRPDFRPYSVAGPVELTRLDGGGSTELRYRYTLDCLTRSCLPGDARRRVVFSPVHIFLRSGGTEREETATWPALIVRSRLAPEDLARPAPRSSVYPVGDVSYRISPSVLFWALAAVAALLVLVAAALVVPTVAGLAEPLRRRRFERLGPVERALVLVRLAAKRGDPARRRRALERLGRELEERGRRELGEEACRLAWSETAPAGASLLALAGRVETALREGT